MEGIALFVSIVIIVFGVLQIISHRSKVDR